jgi:hypothetical protein
MRAVWAKSIRVAAIVLTALVVGIAMHMLLPPARAMRGPSKPS